jgi:hypothetical protein
VVPLVQVAWADGHVSQGERLSILEHAVSRGIDGGPAYQQLLDLLTHRPSRRFFHASLQALRSELCTINPPERLSRQRELLSCCTRIASVSRSAIGHTIAGHEMRAMHRIVTELGE